MTDRKGALLDLLSDLSGVAQDPKYHPEGDALYHSLQVFDLARGQSSDPALWAAALLHDVGKAIHTERHDEIGADLLSGLVAPRIVWLVRHHLDLLRAPGQTRRRMREHPGFEDLCRLRRWDVRGRARDARVLSPEEAVCLLLQHEPDLLPGGPTAFPHDDDEEQRFA